MDGAGTGQNVRAVPPWPALVVLVQKKGVCSVRIGTQIFATSKNDEKRPSPEQVVGKLRGRGRDVECWESVAEGA